jgi:hypothetical protein
MERCPSGVNARCAAQNKGPSGFRQFDDVLRGVAERDQRLPARQYDRIEEPLIPRHPLVVSSSKVSLRGKAALLSDPIREFMHCRRAFTKDGLKLRRCPYKRNRSVKIRYLNLVRWPDMFEPILDIVKHIDLIG